MRRVFVVGTAITVIGLAILAVSNTASAGEDDGTTTPVTTPTVAGDAGDTGTPASDDVTPSEGGAPGATATPGTSMTPLAGGGELPTTGTGPPDDGQGRLAWLLIAAGGFALMGAAVLGYANRGRPL